MRYTILALAMIVLIAGCTSVGIKNLPEVKAFLEEYPQSSFTASLYTPVLMKTVIAEYSQQCPALDENETYYKVNMEDPTSKRKLVLWVHERTNKAVCAVSSGAPATTTTTAPTTTTTLPPTTTTTIGAATTTTSGATTTTIFNATTTTAQVTTTSSSTTTTTAPQLTDLIIFDNVSMIHCNRPGYSNSTCAWFTVLNNGTMNAPNWYWKAIYTPSNTQCSNVGGLPQSLLAGKGITLSCNVSNEWISTPNLSLYIEIDLSNAIEELNETNWLNITRPLPT